MTPAEIYHAISEFAERHHTVICEIHSACSPHKGLHPKCLPKGSNYPVIDFDSVEREADMKKSRPSRKSVDALALSPSQSFLCFIEMKSWQMLLARKGTEHKVRTQAEKYRSDLPAKLADSIDICSEISGANGSFDKCRMMYILLTDISVENEGLEALNADLSALAGISSNLASLCNRLSRDIMHGIPDVERRYWECRDFDREISTL